ncbi:hypothetical protein ACI2J4_14000 [Agrobacterium tumefaciens]|uniref:hypothetical protein n=1 Tax=Agrobacterium tumefaciens TaxID=358 RepID=UPI00384D74BF
MQLSTTHVKRNNGATSVEFVGSDGDHVSVRLADGLHDIDDVEAMRRASAVLVQLTAFGTRHGTDAPSQFSALSTVQGEAPEAQESACEAKDRGIVEEGASLPVGKPASATVTSIASAKGGY